MRASPPLETAEAVLEPIRAHKNARILAVLTKYTPNLPVIHAADSVVVFIINSAVTAGAQPYNRAEPYLEARGLTITRARSVGSRKVMPGHRPLISGPLNRFEAEIIY